MQLTIFYDALCPLCQLEMQHLKKHDHNDTIRLVNLHDAKLIKTYPFINKQTAMTRLHGQLANGEMLYGLDVTCKAWSLVGKYRWLTILRWPVIKPVADVGYRLFARYREDIAYILTGKKHCTSCKVHKE